MELFRWLKNACAENQAPVAHSPDGPHTPLARRRFCFSGFVQGVGFRYEARRLAVQLGLSGWARNESDGTVTVELEGETGRIGEFLRAMQTVPRFDITDIQTEDLPLSGAETTFKIRY